MKNGYLLKSNSTDDNFAGFLLSVRSASQDS